MFLHSYQSGTFFEIFDPKEIAGKGNKEKTDLYKKLFKIKNPIKAQKIFDQQLKGFIFELDGHSTKMQFPKDGDLGLIQQFLILQVFIIPGYNWTLELDITDITKTKRRVVLTDSVKKLENHHFHIKSPIEQIRRGQWLNLCIDVWSFMEAFKGSTFRSIDTIVIGSPCKLRKIFLMKNPIQDSELELTFTQGFVSVPKQVNYPEFFYHNDQIVTFRLLNYNEFSLSQQIQNIPDNAHDKYVYDQKQYIDKVNKVKYTKPEFSQNSQQQQDFKTYEQKDMTEKLDSQQDFLNSYSEEKEKSSYFEEVEQIENYDIEDDEDDGQDFWNQENQVEDQEMLKLVYDPKLKCFYDPETNEYYQLNSQ